MIDQFAKQIFSDIQNSFSKTDGTEGRSNGPSASQLKAIIESGLKRLNLVTREEFDAQAAVLLRTREKLDALEKKLAELEQSARD